MLVTGATGYVGGCWHARYPIHTLIFNGMIRRVAERTMKASPRARARLLVSVSE
ncbi:MAG: hypothetical protein AB7Q16_17570 [Vicinamibacterales bacterium]